MCASSSADEGAGVLLVVKARLIKRVRAARGIIRLAASLSGLLACLDERIIRSTLPVALKHDVAMALHVEQV